MYVSQVLWDPIKNRVSPRSALFEAVYLVYLITMHCTKLLLPYHFCCPSLAAAASKFQMFGLRLQTKATLHCWQSSSILSHFAQPMGLKNISVLLRLLSFLLAFVLHKSQFSNYFANIRY